MKYIVEFGVRGGAHTENQVMSTRDQAEKLARALVMVFCNDPHAPGATASDWLFSKPGKRMTWANETHFVAVSKLDGKPRGPASASLWRKTSGSELLQRSSVRAFPMTTRLRALIARARLILIAEEMRQRLK